MLPSHTVELVGPDRLTGPGSAELWTDVPGSPIRYAGDDIALVEHKLQAAGPAWFACDMRLMMSRYQQDGAAATTADLQRLATMLGRAPRS